MVGQEHVIRERQVEQQGGGQAEVTFAHGLEVRPGKEQHTYDISSVITSRMHDSMLASLSCPHRFVCASMYRHVGMNRTKPSPGPGRSCIN